MTTQTAYAQAQATTYAQRPPDQRRRSRSVTGQVPAKLEAKALADFRRFYAKATDDDTRAYLAREIRRLGGTP